jgi:hypothetical protein
MSKVSNFKHLFKKLYPIEFKGKLYYKKDCNNLFQTYYTDPAALTDDGSVYVGDGIYVFPNDPNNLD